MILGVKVRDSVRVSVCASVIRPVVPQVAEGDFLVLFPKQRSVDFSHSLPVKIKRRKKNKKKKKNVKPR